MPYDAITIGNHELYHNETVGTMRDSGFVESWQGRYLTANVLDASTGWARPQPSMPCRA